MQKFNSVYLYEQITKKPNTPIHDIINEETEANWTKYQSLSFSSCQECNKTNTEYKWCRTCNAAHFRNDFDKWTSENKVIDYFIQNTQIHASNGKSVLEWYPWETFSEIKKIREGGYGTIFCAKTKLRRIRYWDHQRNQWNRSSGRYVTLKPMNDSELKNFLNEAKRRQQQTYQEKVILNTFGTYTLYGFTKNPRTGQYLLVLQHFEGDLHKKLQNRPTTTLKEKIETIKQIAQVMKQIENARIIQSSGEKPFLQFKNDGKPGLTISKGFRPKITKDALQFYRDLMQRYWDTNPTKRTTVNETYQLMQSLYLMQDQIQESEKDLRKNIKMKNPKNLIDTRLRPNTSKILNEVDYVDHPIETIMAKTAGGKQTATRYSESSSTLDQIRFNEPTVVIKSDNNIWDDAYCRAASNFVSVNATVSPGISATAYVQVERLISLLIKRKDDLDRLLDSQPVYAVGPDFQQGHVPCIACWVAKPLEISVIQRLSALFDDEFEVMEHMMEPMDEEVSSSNNNNKDDAPRESSNNCGGELPPNNHGSLEKQERDGHGPEEKENRNSSDSGGGIGAGGDSNHGVSKEKEKEFILISSSTRAGAENHFQSFGINMRLWANVSPDDKYSSDNTLEFHVDLYKCAVGELLSDKCSLRGWFGYFLDSVRIGVSPLPFKQDDISLITVKNAYIPQVKKAHVECSTDHGVNAGGQLQTTGAAVGCGVTNNLNTKSTTVEWDVDYTDCDTHGVQWTYTFTASNLYKPDAHRLHMNPGLHSGHWYIKNKMKGFRITVTQVVGCKFTSNFFHNMLPYKKPEPIRCPKMTHTLEITFNASVK